MAKLQEAQPESGSKSGNTDLSWGSFYCDAFKACRNRTQRQAYHGATKDPWCAFPRYSRLCLPAKQTKAEIEKAKSNCTNYNIVHDCINCITLSPCTKTTSSNLPAFRSLRVALLSPHLDVVTGSAPCVTVFHHLCGWIFIGIEAGAWDCASISLVHNLKFHPWLICGFGLFHWKKTSKLDWSE